MKTKKLLSLLLALMMMLSVVPMYASAAEPIALTTSNVTEWPTTSFINGVMYCGQTVGECVTLNGGKVEYNGEVVPGHFEFMDLNATTASSTNIRADIKFIPDDETKYTGFESKRNRNVTYFVSKVTPIPVDENDTVPVATEVEAGAELSTSTLSGAKYTNPYNPNEPKILAAEWIWGSNSSTIVNESGYYQAFLGVAATGYTDLYEWVLVRVKGDTSEVKMSTKITEVPTASVAKVGDKLSSVVLSGGKAIGMNGEEVSGTFSFEKDYTFSTAGKNAPNIVFTPDDERYASSTTTINITVEKAPIKFVDENGAEIVPEITVDYGTEVGDYINLFKGFATNCNETLRFILADEVKNAVPTVGTHEYEVTAATFKTVGVTSNYEDTVLKFKVIVEPMELAVKFLTETGGQTNPNYCEIGVTSKVLSARPQGTFAIYVDGVLLKDGLKYQERVEWPVAASKTYELKVVYTPVDNDPYIIEDYTDTIKKNHYWMFTSGKNVSGPSDLIACGATVEISANLASENFAGWKVTDAKGNEVTLDGVDNSKTTITITMPDYDIHVEALEKNASSGGSGGLGDIDLGDLSEGDSEWAIINIIRNLIAMFKSFLQQLIETFQSIGD